MSEKFTLPEEWQTLSSPKIPEFKVWVTMGDKVLTSHKKDTFDPADVGAEIAGIEGREFQIWTYDGRSGVKRPFGAEILMDGNSVGWYWKPKSTEEDPSYFNRPANSEYRARCFDALRAGRSHERPFVFGKIATTSNPTNSAKAARALTEVGTIKIKYIRLKNVRQVRVSVKETSDTDTEEDEADHQETLQVDAVDEKAKKAQFGLSAGFGDPRPVERKRSSKKSSGWTHVWKYTEEPTPLVTYTFRIRSPLGLQDEILPDEPVEPPSKRPADSAFDDDDDEDVDVDEIDAELRALEERAARLRAKRAKTVKPDIKPQVTPSPPYDWQGNPPIEKETRWYLDFNEEEAEEEEARMIEKEKLKAEERRNNAVDLD